MNFENLMSSSPFPPDDDGPGDCDDSETADGADDDIEKESTGELADNMPITRRIR